MKSHRQFPAVRIRNAPLLMYKRRKGQLIQQSVSFLNLMTAVHTMIICVQKSNWRDRRDQHAL